MICSNRRPGIRATIADDPAARGRTAEFRRVASTSTDFGQCFQETCLLLTRLKPRVQLSFGRIAILSAVYEQVSCRDDEDRQQHR